MLHVPPGQEWKLVGMKALLCDDHPLLLRGLADLIAAETDVEVVAMCPDGEQALAALVEHAPELAILDIAMPGMSGIEAYQQARAKGWNGRAILLTAGISDGEAVQALALGIDGIVLKGASTTRLVEAIRTVAHGGRWMSRDVVRAAGRRTQVPSTASPLADLTARERDVASLVADGRSNRDVAKLLQTTEGTVKSHLHNIYEKLGVDNRTAVAILMARERSPDRAPSQP